MTEGARPVKHPLYEMVVEGKKEWMSLGQAGAAYNNGFVAIEFGKWVIDGKGARPRRMTSEDHEAISDMADAISDSK